MDGEMETQEGQQTSEQQYMTSEGSTPASDPAANESAASQVPAQGGEPQTPGFNAQEWQLNYKGRPISIRDRNHLVSLATKGYGFDQEIDRLKQREAQLQEMSGKYQHYESLEKQLQANPALKQKLFAMAANPQQLTEEGEQEPEYVTRLRQELDDLKGWRSQWENKQADQELEKEIGQLKSKYTNHDWDFDDGSGSLVKKVLAHAHNNGNMFPTLEAAYRDFMWDSRDTTVKADTLRQQQEKQKQDKLAGKVALPGGKPAPAQKPAYNPNLSYNDLADMAAKRLS